ncbi:MAG: hypothetical protein OSA45_15650 [Halioglobus sp.]|nr:hypothetical protein [Halioglobus sp.]
MKIKIAGISATAILAFCLSAPASAAFLNGTVGFSNGLDTLGDDASNYLGIVSTLTLFDIGTPTNASGGTGDFSGPAGLTGTNNINTLAPSGIIYNAGGFLFTLDTMVNASSIALSCSNGLCTDSQVVTMSGTVSGGGFVDTGWLG